MIYLRVELEDSNLCIRNILLVCKDTIPPLHLQISDQRRTLSVDGSHPHECFLAHVYDYSLTAYFWKGSWIMCHYLGIRLSC